MGRPEAERLLTDAPMRCSLKNDAQRLKSHWFPMSESFEPGPWRSKRKTKKLNEGKWASCCEGTRQWLNALKTPAWNTVFAVRSTMYFCSISSVTTRGTEKLLFTKWNLPRWRLTVRWSIFTIKIIVDKGFSECVHRILPPRIASITSTVASPLIWAFVRDASNLKIWVFVVALLSRVKRSIATVESQHRFSVLALPSAGRMIGSCFKDSRTTASLWKEVTFTSSWHSSCASPYQLLRTHPCIIQKLLLCESLNTYWPGIALKWVQHCAV